MNSRSSADSSESEENMEESRKSNTPPPERKDPDENCMICLDKMQNISFVYKCFHKFCFTCLVRWSNVKPECPLCKTSFNIILHNVRSVDDYETYFVDKSRTSASTVSQNNADFLQALIDLTTLTIRILRSSPEPMVPTRSFRQNNSSERMPVDLSSDDECEILYVKPGTSNMSNANNVAPSQPIDYSFKTVEKQFHAGSSTQVDPCSSSSNINSEQEYSRLHNSSRSSMLGVEKREIATDIQRVQAAANEDTASSSATSNSSMLGVEEPVKVTDIQSVQTAANKGTASSSATSSSSMLGGENATDIQCVQAAANEDTASSSSLPKPKKQRVLILNNVSTGSIADDENNLPIISMISSNNCKLEYSQFLTSPSNSIISVVQPESSTVSQSIIFAVADGDTASSLLSSPNPQTFLILDDIPAESGSNDEINTPISSVSSANDETFSPDDDDECKIIYVKEPETSNMNSANKVAPGKPIDYSLKTIEKQSEPSTSVVCPSSSNMPSTSVDYPSSSSNTSGVSVVYDSSSSNIYNYEHDYSRFHRFPSNSILGVVKPEQSSDMQSVHAAANEDNISSSSLLKGKKRKALILDDVSETKREKKE